MKKIYVPSLIFLIIAVVFLVIGYSETDICPLSWIDGLRSDNAKYLICFDEITHAMIGYFSLLISIIFGIMGYVFKR